METLKPKLRFPDFKDSYQKIKFGEIIINSSYGPRFNGNDYDIDGNVKTIRGTDVGLNGEIKYSQVPTANLDEEFIKNHILEDGDLVMITTADCGLTGVFKKQNIAYIPSAYAVKIKLKNNANSEYYKYFFQTKLAYNQINRFVRKATVANLPGSDILKFDLKLPSIVEQTKVANFLSAVDTKINQLTKKKNLLEQYKKGVMQKIFNQEIRFKDENGNDFLDWEEKKIGDLCKIKTGTSKISFKDDYGKYLIVDMGSVSNKGQLIPTKRTNCQVDFLTYGDLIMPKDDIGGGNIIGRVAFIDENEKYILSDHLYKLFDFSENSKYISFVINYEKTNKSLRSFAIGSAQLGLNIKSVINQVIPIPCIDEQTKIANFLSAIDENINQVSKQLENTTHYKKGLLQQIFV